MIRYYNRITPALLISDLKLIRKMLVTEKHKYTNCSAYANLFSSVRKNALLADLRRTQPLIECAISEVVALFKEQIVFAHTKVINLKELFAQAEVAIKKVAIDDCGLKVVDELIATTVGNVLYLLANHSDVQEKLMNEIESFGKNSDIDYNLIAGIKYLESVVHETLRLYPTLSRLEFVANENVRLGKAVITKDMLVAISVYNVHHDPTEFDLPEKFIPERFMPKCPLSHNSKAFIPTIHPLVCMFEVKLILLRLLQKFKFSKCIQTEESLEFLPGQVMTPKSITLAISKRDDHY